MKILILSDLHLEFASFTPSSDEVDVVILAGDIWQKDMGIYWARDTWPNAEIIYIAGNHEFYGSDRNAVLSLLRSAAEDTDVHFLDDNEVVINGVRFLGATLWTDFLLFGLTRQELCMNAGREGINDFSVIIENGILFTPGDAVRICNTSIRWLKSKLIDTSYEGKTVVITHHLPSMLSVADRYKNDILSACFASNLDELFGHSELWVHGHTHDSFDYIENGTRVICNPRGYIFRDTQENLKFNPGLIVEI
ncbi:MAG TPA: metallophosphoesterase, partial [Methylotenera sp.]|nr:metallophosphoesterase [Methylotenera sp.]